MRLSHLFRPSVLLLAAVILLITALDRAGKLRTVTSDDPATFAPAEGTLEGRVAELPVTKAKGTEFVLQAESWKDESGAKKVRGRVLVWALPGVAVDWGAPVRLQGRLERPRAPALIGRGSYRDYLALQRIHSLFRAESVDVLGPAPFLKRGVSALHARMNAAFGKLDPVPAGVLKGIVLGEKVLGHEVLEDFRDAGAIYLLVTSGLHLSFVLLLAAGLARPLGLGAGPRLALSLAAGALYAILTGAGAPVLRAYAMLAAGAAGWVSDRESGAFQGLVLAALGLLLWEPLFLFQVGFQMSFLACVGIVAAASHWKAPTRPALLRGAVSLLYVSLASQLALAPLLAFYFHKLPLVTVLSNLVLVPWAELLLAAGFALTAASLGPTALFGVLAAGTAAAASGFAAAVKFFAGLPLAWVWVASPGWYGFLACYGAALCLWFIPDWEAVRKLALWGAAALLLLAPVRLLRRPVEEAVVMDRPGPPLALLTGPGRPILINACADGEDLTHAVLDAGAGLDAVVLTSLESSNWRGLEDLSRNVRVRAVLAPPGESPAFDALAGRLAARGVAVERWWPDGPRPLGDWLLRASWTGYSGDPKRDRLTLSAAGRESGKPFDIMARHGAPLE